MCTYLGLFFTGLALHTFHGNFFVRSTDLLSLPNVNPDMSYAFNVVIEESMKDVGTACFQAALLYTSSHGAYYSVCVMHVICTDYRRTSHQSAYLSSTSNRPVISLVLSM